MKNIILLLIILVCSAQAASKYVRTDGHDTASGENDTADPTTGAYLTVKKGTDSINGGDTLFIGDGTYAESAALVVNRNYASQVLITSTSGNASAVIITGAGTSDASLNLDHRSNNTTYSNLTFTCYNATNYCVARIYASTNVVFIGCTFTSVSDANKKPYIFVLWSSQYATNIQFFNCTLNQTGPNSVAAFSSTGSGSSILFSNTSFFVSGACYLANATTTNVVFTNCVMISTNSYAVYGSSGIIGMTMYGTTAIGANHVVLLANPCRDILIDNCDLTQQTYSKYTVYIASTTNLVIHNSRLTNTLTNVVHQVTTNQCSQITISSCTLTGATDCISLQQSGTVLVSGCNATSASGRAVTLGLDNVWAAETANTVSGMVSNSTLRCTSGHGMLLGANCTNVLAIKNTVYGGDYGIVIKENIGSSAQFNTVYAGTSGGIYSKGATNSSASYNRIYSDSGGHGLHVNAGDTGAKNSGISYQHNWVSVGSSGDALYWTSAGEVGNSTNDFNTYFFVKTPAFGTVLADASPETIEEVRVAWVGYGTAGNDSHSWYGPTVSPGFAQ